MDLTITPRSLAGNIKIIPSKSVAHRMLICAAFSDRETDISCSSISKDIAATIGCLQALGAQITYSSGCIRVIPSKCIPEQVDLFCFESASTLRFLLPVVGALGVNANFHLDGRLPQRPLVPLSQEMERMGCVLSWQENNILCCTGKLRKGHYSIDGSVSSQFVTGLMLGLALMEEDCSLTVTGKIESAPYIAITRQVLSSFGLQNDIYGGQPLRSPGSLEVEGDWSNAAFFLTANALGSHCAVEGLSENSVQGDKVVVSILEALNKGHIMVDGSNIPDLIPVLSVAAAYFHGAEFINVSRLRLKESDRIEGICKMLNCLGIQVNGDANKFTVFPGTISGGTVDSLCDHRIAMSAAIAATVASDKVTILNADCVKKSYPDFWAEYARLGGIYEQHLG